MMVMVLLLLVGMVALVAMLLNLRERVMRLEAQIAERSVQPWAEVTEIPPAVEPVAAPQTPSPAPHRRPAVIIREEAPQPAPTPIEAAPLPLAVEPEPVLTAFEQPRAQGLGIRFEDLFGRKLPIWAGGITLAVAGVLLVKYSIDAGLLSPLVRVIFGLLFGAGLIAGAEGALRAEAKVGDPRVRQALSGAGLASLYAAILAASNLYHLIGPVTAFAGLALVTALAMGLAIRFGAPSALLGLVGGLAAPALVGEGPPNIPLLSAYLALAIGGLTVLSRQQKWMWLGVSALIGGAGWGKFLILTGALDWATSLSLGLLILLLGLLLPLIAFTGPRALLLRSMAAIVAAGQIATLVAKGGFAPLEWGFYLLLAAALGWLAWREERFRPLPPVGLAVGLLLLILWPQPPAGHFAAVLLLLAAIHAGPALVRLWRDGGMIEAGQIAAVAVVGHGILWGHYPDAGDGLLAALAVAAALLPAAGAMLGWRKDGRQGDARFVTLVAGASLLLADAASLALPHWLFPVAIAALAMGLVLLGRAAADKRVESVALVALAVAIIALPASRDFDTGELARLFGEQGSAPMVQALLRWGAVATAAGLAAWRLSLKLRPAIEAVAALLAYGAVAQVAPAWSLPVLAGIGVLIMVEAGRRLQGRRLHAPGIAFALVALAWAARPLILWLVPALVSLGGAPMLVGDVPSLADAVTRLAIPAAVTLFALWRSGPLGVPDLRPAGLVLPGVAALVAAHSLYKQIFHLGDAAAVAHLGLAERTLWGALLLGIGLALWRWRGATVVAFVAAMAALLHGFWYSLILFNPLASAVSVGPLPVLNLLLPAFAILFGALWLIERTTPVGKPAIVRIAHILRMILILLFAAMTLRQLFSGDLLVSTAVGSVENISRSVLAIALAIGFLLWGIRTGRHDWRIGSLLLMLAAVAKVFLLDAAGLEGLLRILSFLALGFSLIGIGWLYSRFLRAEAA